MHSDRRRDLFRRTLLTALALGFWVAGIFPAWGQTNLETNAGIQFSLVPPGARSLGLGGTFLATADDATAAYVNPAGLTQLFDAEISAEGRACSYEHRFTDSGRLQGFPPTGRGVDTVVGLREGTSRDTVAGMSYLSAVFTVGERSRLALFRHRLADFEATFQTRGAFLELTSRENPLGFPGSRSGRLAALDNRMDLSIIQYGLAVAMKVWGERLSLGAAVSYFTFDLYSEARRYVAPTGLDAAGNAPVFQQIEIRPENLSSVQVQAGEATDWSLTAGFLWDLRCSAAGYDCLRLGGVFREGPDFDFRARSEAGPRLMPAVDFSYDQPAVFHVPDFYGLGLAWSHSFGSRAELRVGIDYVVVEYSDLTDGMVDIFNLAALPLPGEEAELGGFEIPDANELHLGIELSPGEIRGAQYSVLLGTWYEPDHTLRFTGSNPGLRAIYQPRGDAWHYSAGLQLTVDPVEVGLSVDHSDRLTTVSLSMILRLRKSVL